MQPNVSTADPRPTRLPGQTLLLLKVGLVALLLGALTAHAQGWLPRNVASLANSSGSWALVAFLLALLAPNRAVAMGCAALTLAALVVGYYAANELSGIASSTRVVVFWIVAAAIAGPPLGLSAHWVRGGGPTAAAVGSGIPAGVLIGEGVYGLRYIADTTYRPFWWGEIVLGVALLGVLGGIRLRSARRVALSLCVALAVSAAFVVIYSNGLIGLL